MSIRSWRRSASKWFAATFATARRWSRRAAASTACSTWRPWRASGVRGANTTTCNVVGTRNVHRGVPRERRRAARVTRAARASSFDGRGSVRRRRIGAVDLDVDGESRHYSHSKALAEQAVLAANGGDACGPAALRPHLIWGPRDNHLMPRLIAAGPRGPAAASGRRGEPGRHHLCRECCGGPFAGGGRAWRDRFSGRGQSVFFEPGRTGELLAVDRRNPGAGGPAAGAKVDVASTARRVGLACEAIWRLTGLRSEPPMTRFLAASWPRRTGSTFRRRGAILATSRGCRRPRGCGGWGSGCGRLAKPQAAVTRGEGVSA